MATEQGVLAGVFMHNAANLSLTRRPCIKRCRHENVCCQSSAALVMMLSTASTSTSYVDSLTKMQLLLKQAVAEPVFSQSPRRAGRGPGLRHAGKRP